MTKRIYGRDLTPGELIQTWEPGKAVRVLEIKDHRTQVLNNTEHRLASAYCTNGYNITVFLDKAEVRLA